MTEAPSTESNRKTEKIMDKRDSLTKMIDNTGNESMRVKTTNSGSTSPRSDTASRSVNKPQSLPSSPPYVVRKSGASPSSSSQSRTAPSAHTRTSFSSSSPSSSSESSDSDDRTIDLPNTGSGFSFLSGFNSSIDTNANANANTNTSIDTDTDTDSDSDSDSSSDSDAGDRPLSGGTLASAPGPSSDRAGLALKLNSYSGAFEPKTKSNAGTREKSKHGKKSSRESRKDKHAIRKPPDNMLSSVGGSKKTETGKLVTPFRCSNAIVDTVYETRRLSAKLDPKINFLKEKWPDNSKLSLLKDLYALLANFKEKIALMDCRLYKREGSPCFVFVVESEKKNKFLIVISQNSEMSRNGAVCLTPCSNLILSHIQTEPKVPSECFAYL